jgi:hypothetical protein
MIYICIALLLVLVWREWENMRERRGLMDRIVGFRVVLPTKLKMEQPKVEKAKGIATP